MSLVLGSAVVSFRIRICSTEPRIRICSSEPRIRIHNSEPRDVPSHFRRSARDGISAEAPCVSLFDKSLPVGHAGRRRQWKTDESEEDRESLESDDVDFAIEGHFLRGVRRGEVRGADVPGQARAE